MGVSLLSAIYQGVRLFHPSYQEAPNRIWLGKTGLPLSNSIAGVAYCVVSEHKLEGYVLKINKVQVASGRLEIFLWMLENAPKTLNEAVRLSIQYEKAA